jgi:hypothetical protein
MLCGSACVATCRGGCGGATGAPIECVGCNAAGVRDIAVCEPATDGGACLAGHQRCACAGGVTDCPGATQTCISGSCFGCGEINATDSQDCQAGGRCEDLSSSSLRYTCQ